MGHVDEHCAPSPVKPERPQRSSWFGLTRLLAVGLVLNALLVLPAWWRDAAPGSVWLAPEAWLLPAVFALCAGRCARVMGPVLTFLLAFVMVAGAFDGLVQSVLGRPLNVFVDPLMLGAGFHLLEGSIGLWAALLASLLVALAAAAVAWVVWRLIRAGAVAGPRAAMAVASLALVLGLVGTSPMLPGVASQLLHTAVAQAGQLEATRRARLRLLQAQDDPAFAARALPGLAGRDVYVVYIESYGESLLDQARYAGRIEPLLERWRGRLEAQGLHTVSGRLEAPIRGGQSWLSHATVLSGLPIDSQLWYRTLLARDIDLLTDDFRATGHRTLKLAPAIVGDWPEGRQLGFDRIFAADDLGYRGPRLGWVTMPDEFTLHRFGGHIRPRIDAPVYAQFALISSHWPWTPVIEPTADPTRIDQGRVYERWRGGDTDTLALMFDAAAQRAAYLDSVEYALTVTLEWARCLPDDALLLVLGDHQPTGLIAGRDAGAGVPVHVISGDAALLAGFERRGFVPGLLSPPNDESTGLDRLRHWLREDFGRDLP